jgi:hypothetical protein
MLVKMLEMVFIAGIEYYKSITYAGESYAFKPRDFC